MGRNRFMAISRDLHFNSNSDPRAATDRALKLRHVVATLQQTFKCGYAASAELSFDGAVEILRQREIRLLASQLTAARRVVVLVHDASTEIMRGDQVLQENILDQVACGLNARGLNARSC